MGAVLRGQESKQLELWRARRAKDRWVKLELTIKLGAEVLLFLSTEVSPPPSRSNLSSCMQEWEVTKGVGLSQPTWGRGLRLALRVHRIQGVDVVRWHPINSPPSSLSWPIFARSLGEVAQLALGVRVVQVGIAVAAGSSRCSFSWSASAGGLR